MRLRQLILTCAVGTALLICAACEDSSLNPWFPKADTVLESWLLGKWTHTYEDKTDTITFTRGEGNSYRIEYLEEKSGSKEAEHGFYEARLARIDGVYYLDYQPAEVTGRVDAAMLIRTHGLLRLDYGDNKLRMRTLNWERLEKAAREGKLTELKFAWLEDDLSDQVVLTSSTAELRRFLLTHAREEELFDQGDDFVRGK